MQTMEEMTLMRWRPSPIPSAVNRLQCLNLLSLSMTSQWVLINWLNSTTKSMEQGHHLYGTMSARVWTGLENISLRNIWYC